MTPAVRLCYMRLCEILCEGSTPQDLLKFPFVYGSKTVNVAAAILPEEQHLYSPAAVEAMKEVVIFSIHRSPLSGDLERQDLLKLRNGYTMDSHGDLVANMVDRGVARMVDRRGARLDTERYRDRKAGIPQKHKMDREHAESIPRGKFAGIWNSMQDLLNDSNSRKTIVPVPSSSPLVGMITKAISSRVPNATVSDVLYKDDPMFSDAAAKASNPDHDPDSPRIRTVGNVKARMRDMKNQIAGGDTNPQLQSDVDALQKWVDKQPAFSAKSQYANPRTNRGKWLYGWMKAKPLEVGVPHDVILVDDNVVNGATITTAIKGLMATNPNIRSIRVLVLHQFRNPKKVDPDDYRW